MSELTTATIPKTPMDIYRSLPEGTRAEIIDNIIYMSPAPNSRHQRTIKLLLLSLAAFVEKNNLGEVLLSPMDVYLDERSNAVQPDLIIVLSENAGIVDEEGAIHGVPDILIEVLSTNKQADLIRKKDLYEQFGVKEYYIIEPESGLTFHHYLEDGKYVLAKEDFRKLESRLLQHTFEW